MAVTEEMEEIVQGVGDREIDSAGHLVLLSRWGEKKRH